MEENIFNSCLYDFRVHCDYCNACVKTNFRETCQNKLCQCDLCMKRHPRMLFFTNFENNKFAEACSYHKELFKTPMALKEMINLKDELDLKKITHKYKKKSSNPITRA